MGPRPRGRGIVALLRQSLNAVSLQWGRDRAVAELKLELSDQSAHYTLQWGRDRAVAELL